LKFLISVVLIEQHKNHTLIGVVFLFLFGLAYRDINL